MGTFPRIGYLRSRHGGSEAGGHRLELRGLRTPPWIVELSGDGDRESSPMCFRQRCGQPALGLSATTILNRDAAAQEAR